MKTYKIFIIKSFIKSFLNIFIILFSLIFILNLLSELDYFKNNNVSTYFLIYLSILNAPSLIMEIFPFIFLISVQFFFIELFKENQFEIFKYSGLKNSSILKILSITSFFIGLLIIVLFYNFSSNLKNLYLSLKSPYSDDDKYLAVVTKNGLWIKDKIGNSTYFINSLNMEKNFLKDVFITEFDSEYNVVRNISSKNVNIEINKWIIYEPTIYVKNSRQNFNSIVLETNFDYKKIQSLFSELSSQSILELYNLKKNYSRLGYSTIEINIFLNKLFSYPFLFVLITIFSTIIMFNSKKIKNSYLKISIGLFASVIIYYINNFFYVMGSTEKVPLIISIWLPIIILFIINSIMLFKINEK